MSTTCSDCGESIQFNSRRCKSCATKRARFLYRQRPEVREKERMRARLACRGRSARRRLIDAETISHAKGILLNALNMNEHEYATYLNMLREVNGTERRRKLRIRLARIISDAKSKYEEGIM